ncbi:MAG: glycosyltransferase [Proteobacteria bacterium]|nr:glycosyltransferase [Pseudomonadota bacterium]MBU4068304.1 glycosyltransferase [Pseudomonadota bacterium]
MTAFFLLGLLTIIPSLLLSFILLINKYYKSQNNIINPSNIGINKTTCIDITIVIAARNEEKNIEDCLNSILADKTIPRVIVINDHSSDYTAEVTKKIIERDNRVEIYNSPPLPPGWLGKNHALQTGGLICNSKYILFTDADIKFSKGIISAVVKYAERENFDHVGGMFGIECKTISEEICAPVLIAFALAALSSTSKNLGAGTGAFNLLKTNVYRKIGMHSKIFNKVVDDVSLARIVKNHGYKTIFLDFSQTVTVRLFEGLKGYRELIKRSAIPFLKGSIATALILSLIALIMDLSIVIAPSIGTFYYILAIIKNDVRLVYIATFGYSIYFIGALPFFLCRKSHNGRWFWAFLYPVPLLVMCLSVIASAINIFTKKPLIWRGREYSNIK